jgi:hypothetical protein
MTETFSLFEPSLSLSFSCSKKPGDSFINGPSQETNNSLIPRIRFARLAFGLVDDGR